MGSRFCIAILFLGLLHTAAIASGALAMPFVDGRWSGDIKTLPDSSMLGECWASTTFVDGTTLTLAEQRDESWSLRLSNPAWQMDLSGDYSMMAQVDFYPKLQVDGQAKSLSLLEIAIRGQKTLLGYIENGHTIKLNSDRFNEIYDLEGSAKIIERIRNCVTEQLAGER